MLSGRRDEDRELGKAYGLYAGALAGIVLVLAFLAELGLPETVVGVLVVAVTLVTYAGIGILGRSLAESDFVLAHRSVPVVLNGMATAVAFVGGAGFIGLAGAFFADGTRALALVFGWTVGFLLLAVLTAPYFRKSGAVTVPDFLAIRFGGKLIRLAGVVIVVACCFAALAAAFASAAAIGTIMLGLKPNLVILIALAVVICSSLFGGMRGITLVGVAQAIVLLIGLLVPAVILSGRDYGIPVPQLTYGRALADVAEAGGTIGIIAGKFLPLPELDWFNLVSVAVSLACGIAVLPHVLMRSGTAQNVGGARRGMAWALIVTALIAVTAPAIAAFARAAVYGDVVGSTAEDLPDWVYDYGRLGLVTICGARVADVDAAVAACGGDVAHTLAPAEVAISADLPILGFPDITDLPYVMSALLAAGGIAAALGAANALLLAIVNSLGTDLYGKILRRRSSAGKRLVLTRLILVAVAIAAAFVALTRPDGIFTAAAAAPALAASGFFPAIVLGIWWRRTTGFAALIGVVAGFAVAALHIFGLAQLERFGVSEASVSGIGAAIFGMPAGFAVIIVVSILTPSPTAVRLGILDAIRRPSHDSILEDAGP